MAPAMSSRPSLVEAGGKPFLISALIGRLPAATLQLGLLMFVTGSGLGFALGGLTVAAAGFGTIIGAPVIGRLVDRHGPFRVVAAALGVQIIGLLAILAVVSTGPAPGLILGCAALIGAANPQVGPIARARWSTLARERNQPDLIRVALGYEGACDEISFVVGPALAGILVGFLGPIPAMWCLLTFTVIGEGAFLAYLRTEHVQPTHRSAAPVDGARLPMGSLVWPLLGCLSVGVVFGSAQTALNAINDLRGTPGLTGLIYGCVGIGSAIMSVLVVRLVRVPLGVRIAVGGVLAGGLSALMSVAQRPGIEAILACGIGLAVGAVLVSSFAHVEQSAPSTRINQAMTLAATCLTLGVSAGAAIAGLLASEPSRSFWPAVAAGALAVVAGVMLRPGGAQHHSFSPELVNR